MPARKTTAAKSASAAKATAPKATAKRSAAKATPKATAPKSRPVPTIDAPLPSGWVRQSTLPASDDLAASKFTTQAQRRMLRAIVRGEAREFADAPAPTLRTLDRLRALGFVSVAKSGTATATKAGTAFVSANPAPVVRVAAEPKAKAAPKAKSAPKATTAKSAPKSAPKATGRKVVRRAAKATA